MRSFFAAAASVAFLAATPPAAHAQSAAAAAEARIAVAAEAGAARTWCEAFGYRLDLTALGAAVNTVLDEAAAAGADRAALRTAGEAKFKSAEAAAVAESNVLTRTDSAEIYKTMIVDLSRRYGAKCAAAAADPLFGKALSAPSGHDPERARAQFVDDRLEMSGLASWQTPAIVENGQFLLLMGGCKPWVKPSAMEAFAAEEAETLSKGDARAKRFYLNAYKAGVEQGKILPAPKVTCQPFIDASREVAG